MKKKKEILTTKDVENFCLKNDGKNLSLNNEEDLDTPFVVSYFINEKSWGYVISTLRLLISLPNEKVMIHIDSTYKVLKGDYPAIPIGFSDKDRHFHIVALCVCFQETHEEYQFCLEALENKYKLLHNGRGIDVCYVTADQAAAIINGARVVWFSKRSDNDFTWRCCMY